MYKKEFRRTAAVSILPEEDIDRKIIKEYVSQPKTNVINTTYKGKKTVGSLIVDGKMTKSVDKESNGSSEPKLA